MHAAVVDHGLQDGSAERAAATVELLDRARRSRPRCRRSTSTGPGGLEAAARRARYAALRAARPHPDSPVLLGHTLDDQAETVLLGLGRGSGAAVARRDARPGTRRGCARCSGCAAADTRAACAARGPAGRGTTRTTPTPGSPGSGCAHEVLPLLEDVLAGGVAEALARTAAQLREDADALDALAADAARPRARRRRPALPTCAAAGRPRAPARCAGRVLRAWLLAARGDRPHRRPPAGRPTPRSSRARIAAVSPYRVGWSWCARVAGSSLRPVRLVDRRSRPPTHERTATVYDGDIASTLVTEQAIRDKIAELAAQIGARLRRPAATARTCCSIGVLKGAVMFMTDLARALPVPVQLEFMAVSSYGSATSSSGVVRILKDLDRDIAGRARAHRRGHHRLRA